MKIKTIDYEALMKNFKCYYDSKDNLKSMQNEYMEVINKYKEKMEVLYNSSTSLILDETTQANNQKKFMELQKEASEYQRNFSKKLTDQQQAEMQGCYDELTKIVKSYSNTNKIDVVLSVSSIVYSAENLDITKEILNEFKSLDLYSEELVEEEVID